MILPAPARSQIIADWKFDLATQSPLAIACFMTIITGSRKCFERAAATPTKSTAGDIAS